MMETGWLVRWISEYGYAALFLCLSPGIAGLPVPGESVVVTGGMASSLGLLEPIPAFFATYMGLVLGLTVDYVVGRWGGGPVLRRLAGIKGGRRVWLRSEKWIRQYGRGALFLSCFLPGLRHLVPCLVGAGRMRFSDFALRSFVPGLVWTIFYFYLGVAAPRSTELISQWHSVRFPEGAALVAGGLILLKVCCFRLHAGLIRGLTERGTSDWRRN
jgi:membrane-associated protein